MSTLITGGTGFIGGCVAHRLLSLGRRVVIVARVPDHARHLATIGARVVSGDLLDPGSLTRAAAGCRAIVHAAGVPRPASLRTFRRVHVGGTAAVIEAARAVGATRLVNIASQAVVFDGHDLIRVDETYPYPTRYIDPYSATKAQAERLALGADKGNGGDLSVMSLRPAVVWGPGDTTVLPIMARLARSPLGVPMCGDGRNIEATTYIENLVDAVVSAIDAPPSPFGGRAYFITDGFSISWKSFLSRQLEASSVRPRFRRVPTAAAVPAAWMLDTLCGALGLAVPLARFGVRTSMTSRQFETARARDELGFTPRIGLEQGLEELNRWVAELGGPAALLRAKPQAAALNDGRHRPLSKTVIEA